MVSVTVSGLSALHGISRTGCALLLRGRYLDWTMMRSALQDLLGLPRTRLIALLHPLRCSLRISSPALNSISSASRRMAIRSPAPLNDALDIGKVQCHPYTCFWDAWMVHTKFLRRRRLLEQPPFLFLGY